ncbi:MAG: nucleoside triphosphate pyrophosphohydrolase [Synergistaceae bacterium]|nr:nucleoside triphosphate pyrophosphohydrolase [Synergistaceae bacterium]
MTDFESGTFEDLLKIMKRLRAPGGCPWDAEQTLDSLRRYILEESHELVEAIAEGTPADVCEECGDLLLQVVFISEIAGEMGLFGIGDVTRAICKKLVSRHPHVFSNVVVNDSSEVSRNWEKIKSGERKRREADSSAMAGIPRGLPALLRAFRMQERAAKCGFDWKAGDTSPVRAKVIEELDEFRAEVESQDAAAMKEELGDMFFALVNLARHLGIDPESALQGANGKFAERFREVERQAAEMNVEMDELGLDELDVMWLKAKEKLKLRGGSVNV